MGLYAAIWKNYSENNLYFIENVDVSDNVRFGTQLHGGFANSSFTVGGPKDRSYYRYRLYLGGHVVIFDHYGRRLYEGFVSSTSLSENGVNVSVTGYYARAKTLLDGRIYTDSGTTLYEVVRDTVALVPDWNKWYSHLAYADFIVGRQDFSDDTKLADSLEKVLKFGYKEFDIRPVFFAIWSHRKPYLFPEPTSANKPTWLISISNIAGGEAGLTLSLDEVYNKIWVRYDDTQQDSVGPTLYTQSAEDVISQGKYGVREGVVNAGQYGLGLAIDLRDMALEHYKAPRQVMTAEVKGFVRHFSGFTDYPYRIRAGDLVLVTDMDAFTVLAGSVTGLAASGLTGFVLSTDYDAKSNTLRMDFGTSDIRFESMMARLGLSGGVR